MKKKNRIIALFLAGILLLTTGCGKSKEPPAESPVPAKENGVFVDDSFPVLVLDGELRIGRTANGTGLPHFYSDMLMDTLEQPKG